MSAPVRWGILGAGAIAERFAADARLADGAEVVAVAARDGDRAAAFAERHGIPAAHAGYDAMLADPRVDAVYVATPHALHAEHALRVIRSGRPVLVEKPFTLDAEQADSLRAEAAARGVLVMEGMWTACNPLVRRLAEALQDGVIGRALAVTANAGPLPVPMDRGSGHRLEDPALGASFVLEVLVYPIWVAALLVPSLRVASRVVAAASLSATGIDEAATVVLAGADGAIASLSGGMAFGASEGPDSRLLITGSAGWAELDDVFDPQTLRIGTADGVERLSASAPGRGFAWEIEEASASIRAGATSSALVPVELSVQVMRLLDRARESAGIALDAAR